MPKIILNEKRYIESILNMENSESIDITLEQLIYLLAKYYYETIPWHTQDGEVLTSPGAYTDEINKEGKPYRKRVKENADMAVELISTHIDEELTRLNWKEYYTFKYIKQIKAACDIVLKYDLHLKEFDSIPLLSDELENIKKCDNAREQKVLFACYIYARYKGKNGKIDDDIVKKALFDMANVKGTKLELNKVIKSLRDKGFISQNFINSNITIWVNMGCGEEVFSVDELKNLGYKIFVYLNDDYTACQVCGIPVKKKSKYDGSTKYCKKHAYEVKLQQNNEYYHKNSNI